MGALLEEPVFNHRNLFVVVFGIGNLSHFHIVMMEFTLMEFTLMEFTEDGLGRVW